MSENLLHCSTYTLGQLWASPQVESKERSTCMGKWALLSPQKWVWQQLQHCCTINVVGHDSSNTGPMHGSCCKSCGGYSASLLVFGKYSMFRQCHCTVLSLWHGWGLCLGLKEPWRWRVGEVGTSVNSQITVQWMNAHEIPCRSDSSSRLPFKLLFVKRFLAIECPVMNGR